MASELSEARLPVLRATVLFWREAAEAGKNMAAGWPTDASGQFYLHPFIGILPRLLDYAASEAASGV